jgi:hypothetical protein
LLIARADTAVDADRGWLRLHRGRQRCGNVEVLVEVGRDRRYDTCSRSTFTAILRSLQCAALAVIGAGGTNAGEVMDELGVRVKEATVGKARKRSKKGTEARAVTGSKIC